MSATDFLVSSQSGDGGWGYKRGGMSYVEPTAAALLALADNAAAASAFSRGAGFLHTLQQEDGGWSIAAVDSESGWMTAWAVWALAREDKAAAARGSDWLLRTEGLRVTDPATVERARRIFEMDATLTGWPWQVGDASWVFPTALALLALNVTAHSAHPRVEEGIRYLLDRAISSGGWNIGNPFMLTGAPPATIVNTSLTLISLGGFAVGGEVIDKAHTWLARSLLEARTATEIAWGTWAESTLGVDASTGRARLESLRLANGSLDGNPFTTAVAILALAHDK
jgi:hypothetical protein